MKTIEYGQKESYLQEYNEAIRQFIESTSAMTQAHENRLQQIFDEKRGKVENALINGYDIGTIVKHIVKPFDIVKSNGYYYFAVKERNKTVLYNIDL